VGDHGDGLIYGELNKTVMVGTYAPNSPSCPEAFHWLWQAMTIYKIISAVAWKDAQNAGVFTGAAIDITDGYIHLSTAAQAEETAKRHFHGQSGLVLVAFDEARFSDSLRWEPSRGGDLFPHVYGPIDPAQALWEKALPWDGVRHNFPEGWTA
jgi:uncharacterized protein (DUF952 family)